jgi:CHASE3 domain sensor protein
MTFVFAYFVFFLIGSNVYYEKQGVRNHYQKNIVMNKIS